MAGVKGVIGLILGLSLMFVVSAQVVPSGCSNAAVLCAMGVEEVSMIPHDSDCGQFCMCDLNGQIFVMPCYPGTHFNAQLGVCDLPEKAGCLCNYKML